MEHNVRGDSAYSGHNTKDPFLVLRRLVTGISQIGRDVP